MKQIVFFYIIIFNINVNLIAQSNQINEFSNSISWINNGVDISNNSFGNMHPRVSKDRLGNPLVIWGRMSDQSVMFSKWNGTSFSPPIKLNPTTMNVATASWMGPDIAAFGDTVYVIVKQIPEASNMNYIYLIRSFDGGQNFVLPVRVDLIGDSISRFPTITTDDIGNPVIAFMKFNSSLLESRWVVTKSLDLGATFSTDVMASGWGGASEVCDCCPGAIVNEGNKTGVLYRNNNANIRDCWIGVSTDNSETFAGGCNIDDNNWMIMSCPSTGPDGIIIGDTVHSVFMSGGTGNSLVYYSKSSLNTISLNSVTPLTANFSGLTQQNYPRIENNGNAAAVVWKQVVNGITELALLFTNDLSSGFTQPYDTVDLNNITNTDVILNDESVFVVWQDDNSGTVKYSMGTYTSSSAGFSDLIDEELFSVDPNPVSKL